MLSSGPAAGGGRGGEEPLYEYDGPVTVVGDGARQAAFAPKRCDKTVSWMHGRIE